MNFVINVEETKITIQGTALKKNELKTFSVFGREDKNNACIVYTLFVRFWENKNIMTAITESSCILQQNPFDI